MSARRQNCCPTAPSWGTKLFLRFLADSRQLQHLSLAPFNLHKARVRRACGFLLTTFSNACRNPLCRPTLLPQGAPPKSTRVTREKPVCSAVSLTWFDRKAIHHPTAEPETPFWRREY